MLTVLALRHFMVRKRRAAVLLLGYGLGVGVMIVLLSVGEAMLVQSRDVALVGGGEVTVLPEGIDIETMRTGGVSGMFFAIDRARFVARQAIGGPRHRDLVRAVSPEITGKLLYLESGGRTVPVRATGDIPSRTRAAGSAPALLAGAWEDAPADVRWIAPTPQQLYDELDRFHRPTEPDSTWAEWHYFNVVTGPGEWWHLTFMVVGAVGWSDWGGRILATHRRPDGVVTSRDIPVHRSDVAFDTTRADVRMGRSAVRQRDGTYTVRIRDERIAVDLTIRPEAERYFPAVELSEEGFRSGYVVPVLRGKADGRLCDRGICTTVQDAAAYHDHNWGVWRDVTWEWGAAGGGRLSLLYGGVRGPVGGGVEAPFFLALADSLGILQVLRFDHVEAEGNPPRRLALLARQGEDRVRLAVEVVDRSTTTLAGGRRFVQMRGRFILSGRVAGREVSDSGLGFFETWR